MASVGSSIHRHSTKREAEELVLADVGVVVTGAMMLRIVCVSFTKGAGTLSI